MIFDKFLSKDEILTLFEKAILANDEATIGDLLNKLDKYDKELEGEDLEWLVHFSRRYSPKWVDKFETALEKYRDQLEKRYRYYILKMRDREGILTLLEKAILTDDEETIDDLLGEYDDELEDEDLEWLVHFSRRHNPEWVVNFKIAIERRDENRLDFDPDSYYEKYPERLEIYELRYALERCESRFRWLRWFERWWPWWR